MAIQFLRQSLRMYRATKQWQLSRYMNLLFREGVIYFLVTLAFGLVNIQTQHIFVTLPVKWLSAVLRVGSNVPVFTLPPRFILSIRALYARDLRDRRGYGIDTGFGISSLGNSSVGGTAIVFADMEGSEGSQQDEEIRMEEGEDQLTRVVTIGIDEISRVAAP
ncbi:hypothetical protein EV363DRAFT_1401554 [Boletus edulis]|uniref:Uncharacterized protein n=1 Tax=Boletus edulis BED1 TaxID=1328754 RepID=A0AAD4GNL8_BOLED|nr:hypothetical protein EV363DRAFT_1401554 [Boletus edulis]KAF8452859.1 hypothetical protein L210DRAFT_2060279 [Boletus edulis BED1]